MFVHSQLQQDRINSSCNITTKCMSLSENPWKYNYIHHHESRLSCPCSSYNSVCFPLALQFLLLGVHEKARRGGTFVPCVQSIFWPISSKLVKPFNQAHFHPSTGVPAFMSCWRSEHRTWRTPRNCSSSQGCR